MVDTENNALATIIMRSREFSPYWKKKALRRTYKMLFITLYEGKPTKRSKPKLFPPFSSLFYKTESYMVNENGKASGQFDFIFHDYRNKDYDKRDIPFVIRWDIKCLKETSANKLVELFASDIHSPQVIFETLLKNCINECVEKSNLSLSSQYFESLTAIQKELNLYIHTLGFSGDTKIIAKRDDFIAPVGYENLDIDCRLYDSMDIIKLQLSADLHPDPTNYFPHIHLPLNNHDLKDFIINCSKKFMKKHTSLHKILFQWSEVQNEFRELLTTETLKRGWIIDNIITKITKKPTPLPHLQEIECIIPCTLIDHNSPIDIFYSIQANLIDQGAFKNAPLQNTKIDLEHAIHLTHFKIFSKRSFKNIVLSLAPLAKNQNGMAIHLKESFELELKKISNSFGYDIQTLQAIPKIPLIQDLRKSTLEIILTEEEGLFTLKDSNIKATLNLRVQVDISDINLETFVDKFSPTDTAASIIKPIIKKCVEKTLIKISCRQYHNYFQVQFTQRQAHLYHDVDLATIIENAVKDTLKASLGIRVREVNISFKDTLFSKVFRTIKAKTIPYKFDLPIPMQNRVLPLTIEGAFNIDWPCSDDRWLIFQQKNYLYEVLLDKQQLSDIEQQKLIEQFVSDVKHIIAKNLEIALKIEFNLNELLGGYVCLPEMRDIIYKHYIQDEISKSHGIEVALAPYTIKLKSHIEIDAENKKIKQLYEQYDKEQEALSMAQLKPLHTRRDEIIKQHKNNLESIEKELLSLGILNYTEDFTKGFHQEIRDKLVELMTSNNSNKEKRKDITIAEEISTLS